MMQPATSTVSIDFAGSQLGEGTGMSICPYTGTGTDKQWIIITFTVFNRNSLIKRDDVTSTGS